MNFPIEFMITEIDHNGNITPFPDVRFSIKNIESHSVQATVLVRIFLGNRDLGYPPSDDDAGYYCGKYLWSREANDDGYDGHFKVHQEAIDSEERLKIEVEVRIKDKWESKEILCRIKSWVYNREQNKWWEEPSTITKQWKAKNEKETWIMISGTFTKDGVTYKKGDILEEHWNDLPKYSDNQIKRFVLDPQELRERCLKLSNAIFGFVAGRIDLSRHGTDRIEPYAIETMRLFNENYDRELYNVYKMLQIYGTNNNELNRLYKKHDVKDDMNRIGILLNEIANKIPEYG